MTLSLGVRLGPYEVLGPLGAGGMGEVYRGKDTRLDRSVAIKVLPSHLSSNPDLRARFEREARAVSSLNHPHICTLHDVGQQDGIDYIVMELVEGETLLDRLKKGPLPLDQALRYGIEVADALDKAHRQGVIHRDLKPGNVMLTKAGSKLMDFGLAKQGLGGESGGSVSALPTRQKSLTEAGSLLGTFQYMSPEQLEGKDADARSDLWALGCVLYEMPTGKRAFEGKSQASLISAIMTSEPQPIAQLQPMTPPALDRLVKVCLAKDPDDRLQTAHDVMQELKWIVEGGTQPAAAPARAPSRRERRVAAASLIVGALAAWWASSHWRPALQPERPIQFEVRPPEGTELQPYLGVSPDGARIAFTAKDTSGVLRLFVLALRTGKTEEIAGTEGATGPFWSPDGRSVGFYADSKLKRVDMGGGTPQAIVAAPDLRGATWSRDGWIVYAAGGQNGLLRVRASGGGAEELSGRDPATLDISHRFPQLLPDGRQLLYLAVRPSTAWISLKPLEGGATRSLLEVGSAPLYDSQRLLFVRDGALRALAFDLDKGLVTGEPATVAEDIATGWDWFGGIPVSTAGGVLAYRRGSIGLNRLTWFGRDGRELGNVGSPQRYSEPALSLDGHSVAVGTGNPPDGYLAILDLAGGALRRLTFGKQFYTQPCFSPDGRSVAYSSNPKGHYEVFSKPVSGAGAEELLVSEEDSFSDDFSPDGRFLLFDRHNPRTQFDLWVLPMTGERKAIPFVQTEANESHGTFSPDSRFVAYPSDVSGKSEIYVRAFPGGEGPWQISTGGGDQPRWRGDGRELFYLSPDLRLMAAPVSSAGTSFKAEPPRPLFTLRTGQSALVGIRNDYVVAPDGQRFLVNKPVDDPAKATITVVVNWAARLPR